MGLIKGGLIFLIGFVLLLSFIAMNTCLTITLSLDQENLLQNIEGSTFIDEFARMEFNRDLFTDVYYKEYSCEFSNCISEEPMFLVSKQAQMFWLGKFGFFLLLSTILVILLILLHETKEGSLLFIAVILVVSALPFIGLESVLKFILSSVFWIFGLAGGNLLSYGMLSKISNILLSSANFVFFADILAAIVLVVLWAAIKSFKLGSFLGRASLSKEDSSVAVKEVKQKEKIKGKKIIRNKKRR